MPADKKNSLWLSTQYVITILFFLFMLKLNINHFGKDIFGIWIIITSIWGVGSSIDLGFGLAIVKYIAQYKDDQRKVNKILSSIFFVFILLGFLIFLLGIFIAYGFYFSNSTLIGITYLKTFQHVFFVLGFSFILQYFSIFFKSIIEGLNRFYITSAITILQNTFLLIGVALISILNFSISYLSYLYLTLSLFVLSFYIFYYKLHIGIFQIRLKNFEFAETKKIFRLSFSIQLMNVCYSIIDPIIKYMIGSYYNVNSVPAYEIARKFALAISGLFFNAFRIILPKASSLKNKEEIILFIKQEVTNYSRIGIIYSGFTFGVLLLPTILIMNFVFDIKEAIILYLILILPETVNNFGYSIYNFLLGVGKVGILSFIQINNLIFISICLPLGFYFFDNIIGLLGYFFSVIIGNILMILYINRNWYVTIQYFNIRSSLYKLVILLSLICAATIIFYNNWLIHNYLIFAVVSAVSFFLFFTDIKEVISRLFYPIINNFKAFNK
ncbi:MAG: oligosaccharide flippase family protein [Melioribacteraceae bacterium]|nr:oligosaccharide flippase family protein [Melioribacteraceae bacterium]